MISVGVIQRVGEPVAATLLRPQAYAHGGGAITPAASRIVLVDQVRDAGGGGGGDDEGIALDRGLSLRGRRRSRRPWLLPLFRDGGDRGWDFFGGGRHLLSGHGGCRQAG